MKMLNLLILPIIMTVLDLVVIPDYRLRTPVKEEIVNIDQTVQNELDNMLETMYKSSGIGLASVQVGIHKRMFVMDLPDIKLTFKAEDNDEKDDDKKDDDEAYLSYGGPFFIINPKIIEISKQKVKIREGCLSIPGRQGEVIRPKSLVMEYLDREGNKQTLKATGLLARCIQHEIDHLNGILYIDHLPNSN